MQALLGELHKNQFQFVGIRWKSTKTFNVPKNELVHFLNFYACCWNLLKKCRREIETWWSSVVFHRYAAHVYFWTCWTLLKFVGISADFSICSAWFSAVFNKCSANFSNALKHFSAAYLSAYEEGKQLRAAYSLKNILTKGKRLEGYGIHDGG